MLDKVMEFLPFLIPLALAEIGLFIYALHHVLTHDKYKMGNRTVWLVVVILLMNFVGPILYFVLGKED